MQTRVNENGSCSYIIVTQAIIIFLGTRGDEGRLQRQENKSSPAEKADFSGRTNNTTNNPNAITMTEHTE